MYILCPRVSLTEFLLFNSWPYLDAHSLVKTNFWASSQVISNYVISSPVFLSYLHFVCLKKLATSNLLAHLQTCTLYIHDIWTVVWPISQLVWKKGTHTKKKPLTTQNMIKNYKHTEHLKWLKKKTNLFPKSVRSNYKF